MTASWNRLRPLALVLLAVFAAAGLVALYRVDPSHSDRYPKCAFHWLTGLHCPGCGSTRALHALLHGRLGEALQMNALLVLGIPGLALMVVWQRRYGIGHAAMARLATGIALLVVAFGIVRNIPRPPFDLLAPPAGDRAAPARSIPSLQPASERRAPPGAGKWVSRPGAPGEGTLR